MRLLLSNDDGVRAAGLGALRSAVADLGEVAVAAPRSPQSAAGHAITLKRAMKVERVRLAGADEAFGMSVDGRPADCVRLAVRNLMPAPPDLVLAGINAGANVGINVFYSGTVAAAAEAAMLGIPAVAFSAETATGELDFARAAALCRWVLDRLLALGLAGGDLINVNLPDFARIRPRGVRVVRQSRAEIEDLYHVDDAGGEVPSYRLGDEYRFIGHRDDDVTCLAEGYVTVTPLHVDMTNHDRLPALEGGDWSGLPPGAS
jgi:5'-nucleotidase